SDGDLMDAVAEPQHPACNLRLDVKAITLEAKLAHQVNAHCLEPALHVLDIAVEEHVGGCRHQPVADDEPVRVGGVAQKASHAVHHIATAAVDGRDHDG